MKDDRLYLHHMLERCRRITRFIGPGRETFMASEELQDAVIRNVEVIGETAKRVSADVRGRLASLDWRTQMPELQTVVLIGSRTVHSTPEERT